MIKHFCDICEKRLSVQNTASKDTALLMRDFDGMHNPLYHTIRHMEICDDCANTLCDVMDILRQGKEVKCICD